MSLIAQAITGANQITNPAAGAFGTGNVATTFASLAVTLWRTAITLGGVALLVMLIYGGLEWILAGGEKGKVEAARERMTQAVVGMFVLIGTIGISVLIGGFLGINLLQPTFANNIKNAAGGGNPGGGPGVGGGFNINLPAGSQVPPGMQGCVIQSASQACPQTCINTVGGCAIIP